ncbi:CT623 protein [Candidatus Similichlamydia laticola]|uniref:CT623 protein n=1 Tax=Candidatus Similichlamydia laticola TaxID=2170265 RepID=A0A369K987_9BACT|nr:CT623 protein [Candidatus Similichlamydia laticola]
MLFGRDQFEDDLLDIESDIVEFADDIDRFFFEKDGKKRLDLSGVVSTFLVTPYDANVDTTVIPRHVLTNPNWNSLFRPGTTFFCPLSSAIQLRYRDAVSYGEISFSMAFQAGRPQTTFQTDRAYIGLQIWSSPDSEKQCCVEVGRQGMGDLAFSKVQYGSYFDGLWTRFDFMKSTLDLTLGGGVFMTDSEKGHIGQLGVVRIGNLKGGLFVEASVVNWDRFYGSFTSREKIVSPFEVIRQASAGEDLDLVALEPRNYSFAYLNSQYVLGLRRKGGMYGDYAMYAGIALNHRYRKYDPRRPYNKAFFLGLHLGETKKAGDIEFDAQVCYVEPFSVKETDLALGSRLRNSMRSDLGVARTGDPFFSRANVMGPKVSLSYAVSDHLRMVFEASCGMPVIGNYPVSTRTALGFGYAF